MNPETALRRRICAMITQEFPEAWWYHSAFPLRSGVPDLLICYRGRFVALEVKTLTGDIKPLQRHTIDEIRRCGGIGEFVRSVEEARKVLMGVSRGY
jgi:hypothetical protein